MTRVAACLVLLAASLQAAAAPLALRRDAAFPWLCAGVGADERRALTELRHEARIEVLFVTAKRGGYLAGAQLSIYGEGGARLLLEMQADGPICLVDPPPGAYRLQASYGGAMRTARVTVPPNAAQPRKVVFAFPEEPWNGIRASPEEKRQAAQP